MRYVFDYYYLEKICAFTVQGMTLKKIATLQGMPSVTILYSWTKRYPFLKNSVRRAKETRILVKNEKTLDAFIQKNHYRLNVSDSVCL